MDAKKYSFGKITYLGAGAGDEWVRRIIGVSNSSPNLINNTDIILWRNNWKARGEILGVHYVHSQNGFDKDTTDIGGFSQKEIEFGTKYIANLLESYNMAVIKYNEEIAEPFVRERTTLLDTVLAKR